MRNHQFSFARYSMQGEYMSATATYKLSLITEPLAHKLVDEVRGLAHCAANAVFRCSP